MQNNVKNNVIILAYFFNNTYFIQILQSIWQVFNLKRRADMFPYRPVIAFAAANALGCSYRCFFFHHHSGFFQANPAA